MLPLVLALVPLVIAPGLLFYYDVTPKIAILLLGVAAALPWFSPGALTTHRRGRWLCALLGAQGATLIVSTLFSTRLPVSVFGTNWRRYGLILQLAILLFTAMAAADLSESPKRLRLYLRAITAAAIPISLYGIAQYFGWDPWISTAAYHVGGGYWTLVRPPSTLGYVSYFANFLVFAVFFGAALYRDEGRGWWKLAGAVSAILAVAAVVLSGTRGAMLGMLAGGVYLWLMAGRPIRRRVVAAAGVVIAAIALFVYSPSGLMLRNRVIWSAEDLRGGARLLLFRDSLRLAGRHLLVGIGPETFSAEFPEVQSAALSRSYPDFYHESPHNILLDALTAQGIAGALALAGLIGLGLYTAYRSDHPLAGILGACLVGSLVAHQFTVFTAPTALYFYVTLAMLVSLDKVEARPSRIPIAVAIPIAVTFAAVAIRLLVADQLLHRIQVKMAAGNRGSIAVEYSRVRNWGLNADLWFSIQMAKAATQARNPVDALKAWQQAIESGVRATKTADDPHNAWYNLATLHGRQNDFASTEFCLRQAIAASPNWFKPHWTLAQVLMFRGRTEEAKAEAELAADLNGGKNPEVAATLHQIGARK